MTIKNQHNHYNVKFLKGYGHSIKVKDSKIVLTNKFDPFSKPEIESWYADRKRFWLGKIESMDDKVMNESMPLFLNYFINPISKDRDTS